ncbi:hypothetical protein CDN99_11820 [Roseateles aquatilis]|uniref:Uncharacterized protein n=1 Tax=Roseateles aquatilis TaxID=431061 RepID=A0A246JE39_9BURK|nr:hypothetical protein [Roseateles aquatilis]OWQ90844.1 hypothetical protein CDN99_11820 [Roseateles aquatilis]
MTVAADPAPGSAPASETRRDEVNDTWPPHAGGRPVVLVSWDGASVPLALIHFDATPEFDWILFDYTGRQAGGERQIRGQHVTVLSARTECKGEIFHHLAEHLAAPMAGSASEPPEYVALIDDDILVSIGQINFALHLGRCEQLDVFSPTLSHDSPYSHHWMRHQPNRLYREVDWVEVMTPFYRGSLFLAAREYYRDNISSWGLDRFLIPVLQQLNGCARTALLDAVMVSHRRPVTSGAKVYRNGRTAWQERQLLRQASLDLVDREAPALRDSAIFHRLFVARETPNKWIRWKRRIARVLKRLLDEGS